MERAQWGSKIGFILAAAGSAIGLGALWRFPYMVAENGGGAFLFVFLFFTLLIGLPLLIAEFVIGHASRRNPIEGFEYLGGKKIYRLFGYLGNVGVFLLLSFYSVIGGWILIYSGLAILELVNVIHVSDYEALFGNIISNPLYAILGQIVFIALTAFIVSLGVERGLELASKVMMPLLFVLFLVIIVRSITLDGAMEGINFFFNPDFSKLNAEAILYALGHSFFALSVGGTTMITYASYTKDDMNMTQSALSIVFMNIGISILAGLAIFPALSSLGAESADGPGLVFIVLPQVFGEIPFGGIIYVLFIIAFLFATLTSSISMIEINVANVIKGNESKRLPAAIFIAILVSIVGIPSALSMGLLGEFTFFNGTFFDNVDFLVSNIILPIGALFSTIFVGYIMDKRIVRAQFKNNATSKLFDFWIILLKFVLPIVILFVFIIQFFQ